MKRIFLLIFLISVFYGGGVAQELKTFHKLCPSCEENSNVTMTGYEDEFGNIVRHGKLTYVYGDTTISINDIGRGDAAQRIKEYKNVTMNFSNGKLVGPVNAFFTQKNSSLNGEWKASLQYNDGAFVSINATGSDRDTRAVAKISQKGNIVVGPFEVLTLERSPYNVFDTIDYYVGEFDTNGLATGRWRIKGSGASFYSNDKALGNELFFYQGYCIGKSMEGKDLAIKYFIEKSISTEDLHAQGYYTIGNISIPPGEYKEPHPANSIMQNVFKNVKTRWKHTLFGFASYGKINMHLEDNVVVKPFREGIMKVNYSFNIMSEDMYNTIHDNLLQMCYVQYDKGLVYITKSASMRYDYRLHNYYILKADNVTRLYIPGKHKEEMNNLIDEINIKYLISLGAGYVFDSEMGKYRILDKGFAPRTLYIEDSLVSVLDDFIAEDISKFLKSKESRDEKYIGLPKRKQNSSESFVWQTNLEDTGADAKVVLGRECTCEMNTQLRSERRRVPNNIVERWDASCHLSDENAKIYNTIDPFYREEYLNYRISRGDYKYSKTGTDYYIFDPNKKQENNLTIYQMKQHYGDRYSVNTMIFLTNDEKNRIDNEAYKVCRYVLSDYLTSLKKAKADKVPENIRDFLPVKDFEILEFTSELDKGYVIGTFKFTKQVGKKSETETYQTEVKIEYDPTSEKRFKVSESSLVFGNCKKM